MNGEDNDKITSVLLAYHTSQHYQLHALLEKEHTENNVKIVHLQIKNYQTSSEGDHKIACDNMSNVF